MKSITTNETVSTNGMYYARAADVADKIIAHMRLGFDPFCLAAQGCVLFRSVQQETFDREKRWINGHPARPLLLRTYTTHLTERFSA